MTWFFDALRQGVEAGARVTGFVITIGAAAGLIALLTLLMAYAYGPPKGEEVDEGDAAEAKHPRV